MRLSIIVFLLLACYNSFGQKTNYQNLLDTALQGRGALFVHSKPLKITRLGTNEMWYYVEYLKELSNQNLDTAMFSQIIDNTKHADTTLWTDKELPNVLLVSDRGETVSEVSAFQKLRLTDNKQIQFYKKQIDKFNSTETIDRNLVYFSRPVFDNSKKFAILQWGNPQSNLSGGGGIILYQLRNDKTWSEIGIVTNWRY